MVGQAVKWSDVTIAIPTMPQRRPMLAELVETLSVKCPDAAIVAREHVLGDPPKVDFPAIVAAALSYGRSWILQIEDDAWPAADFGTAALAAINHGATKEAGAVLMFSRAKRDVQIMQSGGHWRTQAPKSLCMIQAIALRSSTMQGFSEWAPSWYEDNPHHIHAADTLLGAWLSRKRSKVLVHIPSLVQHREGSSTLPGGRARCRQSDTYRLAYGDIER